MSIIPKTVGQADNLTLRNWLLGAAAAGGGLGGLTSLVNHFSTLNRKAERAKDTSGDDDVMYVNLHHGAGEKMASNSGNVIAMAAAAPAAIGSYALVRQLYEKMKRKQLQTELDSAQNSFLDSMEPGEEKMASTIGGWDALLASPAVLALLTGVGSGVLTNKVLDKNFPAPKPPAGLRPRRLVIRDQPPAEEEKIASADYDDAAEGLLRTVLALPGIGAESGLENLVKRASAGGTEDILRVTAPDDLFEFETEKSASTTSPVRRDVAIGWLVREPEIAPSVKLAAALEYRNACPLMCAMARSAPADWQDDLLKIAAAMCQVYRQERYSDVVDSGTEKSAYDLVDGLRAALEAQPANTGQHEDPEMNLNSLPSEDSTGSAPTKVQAKGPEATKLLEQNADVIDEIMTPKNAPGRV